MASQVNDGNGIALSVQDYVRYPDATAGNVPAWKVAVITAINAGAGTINTTYLKKDGTTATDSAIVAITAFQFMQAGGPGNAGSNRFA